MEWWIVPLVFALCLFEGGRACTDCARLLPTKTQTKKTQERRLAAFCLCWVAGSSSTKEMGSWFSSPYQSGLIFGRWLAACVRNGTNLFTNQHKQRQLKRHDWNHCMKRNSLIQRYQCASDPAISIRLQSLLSSFSSFLIAVFSELPIRSGSASCYCACQRFGHCHSRSHALTLTKANFVNLRTYTNMHTRSHSHIQTEHPHALIRSCRAREQQPAHVSSVTHTDHARGGTHNHAQARSAAERTITFFCSRTRAHLPLHVHAHDPDPILLWSEQVGVVFWRRVVCHRSSPFFPQQLTLRPSVNSFLFPHDCSSLLASLPFLSLFQSGFQVELGSALPKSDITVVLDSKDQHSLFYKNHFYSVGMLHSLFSSPLSSFLLLHLPRLPPSRPLLPSHLSFFLIF